MLSSSQRDAVEALIRDVGLNTILPYFRNLKEGDVKFKSSPTDPVSVADEESERLLKKGLLEILPEALFLGEETYAKDKSVLDVLRQSEKPVWIVDPIDGTSNFVGGREGFGIILALLDRGEIAASWMFEIMTRTMTIAYKGEGTTINGEKVGPLPVSLATLKGQIGRKIYKFPETKAIEAKRPELHLVAEGTPSILSYSRILTGEVDFLIYVQHAPWDHVPGFAAIREVGSVYERWDRSRFEFTDMRGGLIVARDKTIMEHIQTHLTGPLCQYPEILNIGM
jgi:fructose-1,6-bisphosphatase/inositol monophosphatase family enzyme